MGGHGWNRDPRGAADQTGQKRIPRSKYTICVFVMLECYKK
jgi:hypothetical protein